MSLRVAWVAGVVLAVAGAPAAAGACTTFCLDNGPSLVLGKNYDWSVADGLVVVNRRGVVKTALTDDNPMTWTSRYGSVTFNQYGCEFPCGGMNEAGLVVELMWLDDTVYPAPDKRGGLPNLQWIQYQLDVSATVDDVVASDSKVRITAGGSAKIHFLVADAKGGCASVEFLKGKMVVHRGEAMPFRALTNDTYQASAAYLRKGLGGDGSSSLERFARAAARAQETKTRGRATIDAAFALLGNVAQGQYTQWSIVYDIGARRVWLRTRINPKTRWLDLSSLSYSCDAPVMAIDVNAPGSGDLASRLSVCTFETNLKLVTAAFDGTDFLRALPPAVREEHARYPENTRCAR